MRVADPAQMFSRFSAKDKIRFLSRLGWELTIEYRFASTQTMELINPLRLLLLNEIQHRIFSHLFALASKSSDRYPDDELVAIILAENHDRVLNEKVHSAFDRAAEFVERIPS